MPGKNKTSGKGQKTLTGFDFAKYPKLSKPMETVGKTINVPGAYWDKCPADKKAVLFQCVVRDFTLMHKAPALPVSAAFQLQEMGELGRGSLEPGDARSFGWPTPTPSLSTTLPPFRYW